MTGEIEKRRCAATTKLGKPCGSPPVRGADFCLAHSGEETRDSVGFGGVQEGSGRPRNPNAGEMLRERIAEKVEENVDLMLRVPIEAMHADKTLVAPNGTIAAVVPDHPTRLRAWNDTIAWLIPKPPQRSELSGPSGGPVSIAQLVLTLKDMKADAASE